MKLFKRIKENTFEPAGGGRSGTLNYSVGYGTPQGGNTVQDPRHFASSDKTTDHFEPNTSKGSSVVPTMPTRPDVVQPKPVDKIDTTTSPDAAAERQKSEKPLDPTKEFDPQVDQVFQKKDTPSPDEVMSALQYELTNMVTKDKTIAKQTVLNNLKQDPHHYSKLQNLNIDDDKMKVDEMNESKQTKLVDQSTFDKTKAVLDEMIAARQKNVAVANTPEINQIFKDLTDKRQARRNLQSQ